MRNTLLIARTLLLTFRRNRSALLFSMLFPVLLFVVVGSFTARGPQPLDVGVVVGESGQGKDFAAKLSKVPGLALHVGSEETELKSLDDQKRALVFDARHLRADASLSSPTDVPVTVSTARKGEAMAALTLVRQALADPEIRTSPYAFAAHEDGSRFVSYLTFLLPGVIGFAVMQMCVFSVAQGQLYARQSGMLKSLMLTRMTGMEFILGTALSRLVIAVVQALALLLVAWAVFRVMPQGSPLALAATVTLGGMMFVGLGFLISSATNLQEAVTPTANAVMLPMYLLSGVFFPLSSLPQWLQAPAHWLPLTGFVAGLRTVVNGNRIGAGFITDLAIVAAWAAVFILAAGMLLRRNAAQVE